MNYLDSMKYQCRKDELEGEYIEKFQLIEKYYIQTYSQGTYEVQSTLSQILEDFINAQKEGKALNELIGKDVRAYAVQMLKAEFHLEKGKRGWINSVILCIWFAIFLMFIRSFLYNYKGYSLMEKMNHIYFSYFEVGCLLAVYGLDFVKKRLSTVLFFHRKYFFCLNLLLSLLLFLFGMFIEEFSLWKRSFAIRVPAKLFGILVVLSTGYVIVMIYIKYSKTEKKKKLLTESNEIESMNLEQRVCPICNKEHDYDYPKCPFCRNGYEGYN